MLSLIKIVVHDQLNTYKHCYWQSYFKKYFSEIFHESFSLPFLSQRELSCFIPNTKTGNWREKSTPLRYAKTRPQPLYVWIYLLMNTGPVAFERFCLELDKHINKPHSKITSFAEVKRNNFFRDYMCRCGD